MKIRSLSVRFRTVGLQTPGPREFAEIPPSEIVVAAKKLKENGNFETGSDEHLRAILEYFDLRRLTTQVSNTLLDILKKEYPYV